MTTSRTPTSRRDQLVELLPQLRAQLEVQRAFRTEQLTDLRRDDAGDAARREVDEALAEAARWALRETDDALQRMTDGRYGSCEACNEPIGLDSLQVVPQARFCAACQREYGDG